MRSQIVPFDVTEQYTEYGLLVSGTSQYRYVVARDEGGSVSSARGSIRGMPPAYWRAIGSALSVTTEGVARPALHVRPRSAVREGVAVVGKWDEPTAALGTEGRWSPLTGWTFAARGGWSGSMDSALGGVDSNHGGAWPHVFQSDRGLRFFPGQ